ncbi:MAG TPA: hypothetical protein VFZ66_19830 [Herpetosiphonaceae bacterium]
MPVPLLDIGGLWPIDGDGYIVNDASVDKIEPLYRAAVDAAVRAYRAHLGARLHGVYVRGTVPRGQAVQGVSDLDCFAVTLGDPATVDASWLKAEGARIAAEHRCVSDVQLEIWPYDEALVSDRFSEMSFLLKTQSACVWGDDLAPCLPRFKPDVVVANNDISQIRPDIAEAIAALHTDGSARNVLYRCRRIMKNTLRTGCSLVMAQERVFTRDLKPCYELFARHYPDQAGSMRRVLDLAIEPSADRDTVLEILNTFGAWLIAQADAWLDVHNPSKVVEMPLS